MKLVFPGAEHAPFELVEGVATLGRDAGCTVVLDKDGVAPKHCEITTGADGSSVKIGREGVVVRNADGSRVVAAASTGDDDGDN